MAGTEVNGGTLTGIAVRNSDLKMVLVTNLHVMVSVPGMRDVDTLARAFQPGGSSPNRVAEIVRWIPVSASADNIGDVAIAKLDDGVTGSYEIHNERHDMGILVAGVREPEPGMPLTMVGVGSGIRPVRVLETNVPRTVSHPDGIRPGVPFKARHIGVVVLDDMGIEILDGDSGAPILWEQEPGVYRLSAIVFGGSQERNEIWAMSASVAESELGITFGDPRFGGGEMGIPILTSEGFVGQRIIIDDYFIAGERLNAGDVVGIKEKPGEDGVPRVYRLGSGIDSFRVIGIVHTPAAMEVGDYVADTSDPEASDPSYVPVVVKGLAKGLSGGPVSIGDPVSPSGGSAAVRGKGTVARVKAAGDSDEAIVGRALSEAAAANRVIDVLVDLAGGVAKATERDAVEHLGTVIETEWVGASDEWSNAQASVHRSGSRAQFYSFTLDEAAAVNIDLQSAVDSWIYVLQGDNPSGAVLSSHEAGTSHRVAGYSLSAGTYTLEIASSDAAAEGDFAVTIMRDADVSGFTLTPGPGLGTVEVSWQFPKMKNLEYVISHKEAGDLSTARVVSRDGPPVTVIGLRPEVEHHFELESRWSSGNRSFSEDLAYGSVTVFPAPRGLLVQDTTNPGELDVSWTAPGATFDPATDSYELQYRDVTQFGEEEVFVPGPWEPSTLLDPSGTSHLVTGLSFGHYEFRLRAKYENPDGSVDYSAYIYERQYPVSRPAPSALEAAFNQTGTARTALVSWEHPPTFDPANDLSQSQYRSSSNGTFGNWSALADHAADVQQVSFFGFELAREFRVRTKYVDAIEGSERVSGFSYALWRPPAPANPRAVPGTNLGDMVVSWRHDTIFDPAVDSYDLQYRRLREEFEGFEAAWEPAIPLTVNGSSHVVRNLSMEDHEVRVRAVYVNARSGSEGHSDWIAATGYPLGEYPPPQDFRTSAVSGLRVHVEAPESSSPGIGAHYDHFELQTRTGGSDGTGFSNLMRSVDAAVSGPLPYEAGRVIGIRVRSVFVDHVTGGEHRSPWLYKEYSTAFPVSHLAVEFRDPGSLAAFWQRPPGPFGTNRADYYESEYRDITDSLDAPWQATEDQADPSSEAPWVIFPGNSGSVYVFRVRPVYRAAAGSEEFFGEWRYASPADVTRPAPTNFAVTGTGNLGELRVSWEWPSHFFDSDTDSYELAYRPFPEDPGVETAGPWNPLRDSMIIGGANDGASPTSLLIEVPVGSYEFRIAVSYGQAGQPHHGLSEYVYAAGSTSVFHPPANLQVSSTSKRGELMVQWEAPQGFDNARDVYQLHYRQAVENPDGSLAGLIPWSQAGYVHTIETDHALQDLEAALYEVRLSAYYNFQPGQGTGRSSDYLYASATPLGYAGPTGLAALATANAGELLLTWSQPDGFNAAVDYYEAVYREVDLDPETDEFVGYGPWQPASPAIATRGRHQFAGLLDTQHEVSVRAVYVGSGGQPIGWSAYEIVTASPTALHSAPTEFTVEATDSTGQLLVQWAKPASFDARVDKYELQYRTRSAAIDPVTGDYAWNSWEPDPAAGPASTGRIEIQVLSDLSVEEHEVRVRARFISEVDGSVEGYSGYVSATATPIEVVEPADNFRVVPTANAGELSMSWDEPDGFDASRDVYAIYYIEMVQSGTTDHMKVYDTVNSWQPNNSEGHRTTDRTWLVTGLTGAVYRVSAYWIEVDTTDSDNNVSHALIPNGNTWDGDEVEAMPLPMYPPPSNLETKYDGSQLLATWDAPSGFSSDDVYEVQHRDVTADAGAAYGAWADNSDVTWQLSSSASAGLYNLRVRAKYKASDGTIEGYSAWLFGAAQVPSSEAAPTNIQITLVNQSNALASWEDPSDFDPDTDSYEISRRVTNPLSPNYNVWGVDNSTTGTRHGISPSSERYPREARLRAKYVDADDNETYSDHLYMDVPLWDDPAGFAYPPPTNLTHEALVGGDGEYIVSWDPPAGFNPGTDSFELETRTNATRAWSSATEVLGAVTSAAIGPLDFQEYQWVRVRAKFVDAEGKATYSEFRARSVGRPAAEPSPTNLVVTEHEEGQRLDLSWDEPTGFDSSTDKYEVQYKQGAVTDFDHGWVSVVASSASHSLLELTAYKDYSVRVRAVHYHSNGAFYAYSGWVYGWGTAKMGDGPLLQDLGPLSNTVEISGTWVEDHESVNRPGRYARFYSFTLDQDDQVRIDLSSEEDTYLFLLNGAGTGGSVVESDDDDGDGTGSKIVRDLIAGNYTIEATTFGSGDTGDFDLDISLPEAKAPPSSLVVEATANSGELSLSWTAPSEFDSSADRYEVQYSTGSEDPETGDVVYSTWVPLLPHVAATESHVLSSLTHVVHGVRVRAVYYDANNLLEGYSPFVYGEGTPLAVMVTDLGTLTQDHSLSDSWDPSIKSAHRLGDYNARFYSFTLSRSERVRIDLSSSQDTFMYLLAGQGRNGSIITQDDDGGPGTNSRTTRDLGAGDYTVEVTTFSPSVTGNFNLSVALVAQANPPANLQAAASSVTDGEFDLSWAQPTGFDPTTDSYELQHDDGSGWEPNPPTVISGPTTAHTVGTLAPGDTWNARVRAKYVSSGGTITYSDWQVVTLTRASLPSFEEPANFQAGPTANAGELRVTWDNPSGFNPNTDKCELQYRLYYPDPEGDGYIWTPWTPTTPFLLTSESHTFSGLSAALHQVRLRIAYRASNGVLEGRSEYVEDSATPAAAPQSFDPPTGISVTPTATGLSASWTAPAGFNPASDKFQVQYRVEFEDPETGDAYWSSWTPAGWRQTANSYYYVTGLTPDHHQVRVRAAYYDAANTLLAYSNSVSATGTPTGQSGQEDSDEFDGL